MIIRVVLLVTLFAALAHAAQQPARPPRDIGAPTPAATASAAISGRVITADAGAPLRRVDVAAISDAGEWRATTTDDEGRFELPALDAGRWQVTASKTGYLTQQYGQRRPFERGTPIALAAGQRAAVDLALTRASAIAGRIYDEYGEPLAAVRVHVMRSRMAQKRRRLESVGEGDLTDDTGGFRVYGLPPGEYYVSASLRVAPADSVIQTTYAPTYYPGTGRFADAQRVLLQAGGEAVVDFPLLPVRAARVSGVVLNAAGLPTDAFLNLMSEAGELGVPQGVGGATRPDGTFTLPDVPLGVYTLNATLRAGSGPPVEVAAIPLTVDGNDISGLTLVTAPPGSVRGTILADAGVTRRLPAAVDISMRSIRSGQDSVFGESADDAFRLTVPTGPFRINVEAPDGWSVKAILVNNADVTDIPIDLSYQQDVPVRVVLTDRVTELAGTVVNPQPARPASVVVFPADSAKWTPPSRYVRTVPVDERGAFWIAGLPGGHPYLAVAVDGLEEGEGDDPDFLARVRPFATEFTLGEGEKLALDLTVIQR